MEWHLRAAGTGCSVRAMLRRFSLLVATGFGLGYSPVASGTVGTLPGVALAWGLGTVFARPDGWIFHTAAAVLLALLAVPVCGVAERHFGTKDDGRIVADEYLTFPLCLIGLPVTGPVLLLAFVSCRVCDILKPFPADRLQALPGGPGIVADDVAASLYSLLLNHLVVWLWYGGALPPF